jgi:hypothetical protein
VSGGTKGLAQSAACTGAAVARLIGNAAANRINATAIVLILNTLRPPAFFAGTIIVPASSQFLTSRANAARIGSMFNVEISGNHLPSRNVKKSAFFAERQPNT